MAPPRQSSCTASQEGGWFPPTCQDPAAGPRPRPAGFPPARTPPRDPAAPNHRPRGKSRKTPRRPPVRSSLPRASPIRNWPPACSNSCASAANPLRRSRKSPRSSKAAAKTHPPWRAFFMIWKSPATSCACAQTVSLFRRKPTSSSARCKPIAMGRPTSCATNRAIRNFISPRKTPRPPCPATAWSSAICATSHRTAGISPAAASSASSNAAPPWLSARSRNRTASGMSCPTTNISSTTFTSPSPPPRCVRTKATRWWSNSANGLPGIPIRKAKSSRCSGPRTSPASISNRSSASSTCRPSSPRTSWPRRSRSPTPSRSPPRAGARIAAARWS